MGNNTLFVPMEIEALVVNNETRKRVNFQRWKMNYTQLESYSSPMPEAFSSNTAIDWNNTPDANGIYLHWTLPHALRIGDQKNLTGETTYHLVPNRWLIVRYSGPLNARVASAWVVESDFLDPSEGTTAYVDPFSVSKLAVTKIGRKLDFSTWKETGTNELFLTSIGAGEITFSAYQPYNENVFSIHDPLTGVTDPDISYMVSGWYSDPSKDILANVTNEKSFIELLDKLNWTVDTLPIKPCNNSVYQGLCYGIQWDESGPVPPSNRPSTATIAIGNTSIDALTALITKQAEGDDSIDPQLLEAFQYNLLPLLDQPNGPDLLYQAIHKAWFGTRKGGYEWVIVKTPEDAKGEDPKIPYPKDPIDWIDPNLYPNWLSKLNQDQNAYDEAWRELQFLQWKLYSMWWTKGKFDNIGPIDQGRLAGEDPNFTKTKFQDELNVNVANSAAQIADNQLKDTAKKIKNIPNGATQKELEASIEKYEIKHNLPDGYHLKRYSKDSYCKANNPVVLISGSKFSGAMVNENALVCRDVNQLISGLVYKKGATETPVDVASMKGKIPTIDFNKIPSINSALLDDFFFLDPNNATAIATIALNDGSAATIEALTKQMSEHTNETGTLPNVQLKTWEQPWSPMFMLWKVRYYPIAHEENGIENWSFDGQQYILNDKNMPLNDPKDILLNGTTLLTPQSSFNFKNRLDEYRKKHPNLDEKELEDLENFITETDDWDFLSQTLDGFMQALTRKNSESNVVPSKTSKTGKLIDNNNTIVPILGPVPKAFQGWPNSDFQSFRSGQFCFLRFMLVDRFGQSLQLSSDKTYLKLKPVIAPDMKPKHTVLDQEPDRFIQLSPRILQPARLNFQFVSATDPPKTINLNSDVNPICAWILPNHIDRALACYDPSGGYLGELRVITDENAKKVVHWDFAPYSNYTTWAELITTFPHLGKMLNSLIAKGADAFENFFQVIDETLWVIDPLGSRDDQSLSVLVGRPLALTRGRLKYELDGSPVTDPSWEFTFKAANAPFKKYNFPVRLGELKLRNDGLIGYFLNSEYDQFNCVHIPPDGSFKPTSPPYNVQIGIGNFIDMSFQDDSESYLTMLVDPRASVHATTAILPTSILNLPARFVEPALNNMEVTFHVGPLLSSAVIAPSENNEGHEEVSIVMPRPSETNGTWSWLEKDTALWKNYSVKPSDEKVNFSNIPSVLRTGMLKLSNALRRLR